MALLKASTVLLLAASLVATCQAIDINWQAQRGFIQAESVSITIEYANGSAPVPYTFVPDGNETVVLTSGAVGNVIGRLSDWYENNMERGLQFLLNQTTDTSGNPRFYVSAVRAYDNVPEWVGYTVGDDNEGAPINSSFACDLVRWNLTVPSTVSVESTALAQNSGAQSVNITMFNFTIASFLVNGWQTANTLPLPVYNPCAAQNKSCLWAGASGATSIACVDPQDLLTTVPSLVPTTSSSNTTTSSDAQPGFAKTNGAAGSYASLLNVFGGALLSCVLLTQLL